MSGKKFKGTVLEKNLKCNIKELKDLATINYFYKFRGMFSGCGVGIIFICFINYRWYSRLA